MSTFSRPSKRNHRKKHAVTMPLPSKILTSLCTQNMTNFFRHYNRQISQISTYSSILLRSFFYSTAFYSNCAPGAPAVIQVTTKSNNGTQNSITNETRHFKGKAILTLRPGAIDKLKHLQLEPSAAAENTNRTSTTCETLAHDTNASASKVYLKIGVRNKGCSGSAYSITYTTEKGKFDELVEQDGVSVLVDAKALLSIIGSEVDYLKDDLSEQFVFYNPNVKETCGCGLSFTV